jgi:hypothetical protein
MYKFKHFSFLSVDFSLVMDKEMNEFVELCSCNYNFVKRYCWMS